MKKEQTPIEKFFEDKLLGSAPVQPSIKFRKYEQTQEEYGGFLACSEDFTKDINKKTDAELLEIASMLAHNIFETKKKLIFEQLKEARDV